MILKALLVFIVLFVMFYVAYAFASAAKSEYTELPVHRETFEVFQERHVYTDVEAFFGAYGPSKVMSDSGITIYEYVDESGELILVGTADNKNILYIKYG